MLDTDKHFSGRVLLLRCQGALDGEGLTPDQVLAATRARGVRFLLLDATRAAFIDTDGLRWLLRVRDTLDAAGKRFRVAAKPQGKVWRNLRLLNVELEVFDSIARAWKTPWEPRRP